MSDRSGRLALLTGVLFVALLIATFAVGSGSVDSKATGQHVINFYLAHRSAQSTSSFLGLFAGGFLLLWVATLRAYLRRAAASAEGLIALGFAGGVLIVIGDALFSGFTLALADQPGRLDPSAAQALNLLSNDMFFPFIIGMAGFFLGNGLAIVRTGVFPVWLGWVSCVLGLVSMTPLGFFVTFALLVWTLVVVALIFVRYRTSAAVSAA